MSQYEPIEYKTEEKYHIPKDARWIMENSGVHILINTEAPVLWINGKLYIFDINSNTIRCVIPLELINEICESIVYLEYEGVRCFPYKKIGVNSVTLYDDIDGHTVKINFCTEIID